MATNKIDIDISSAFAGNPDLREIPDGVVFNDDKEKNPVNIKMENAFNRNKPITADDIGFVDINDPVKVTSAESTVDIEKSLGDRSTTSLGDLQIFAREKTTGTSAVDVIPRATKSQVGIVIAGSNIDVTPEGVISVKTATKTTLGLVKPGDNIRIDPDGTIHGVNSYVHPDTHPASMIIPDATHRFVTDTQINTWNNKANTSGTYTGLVVGSANRLTTARNIILAGGVTGSASFDGSNHCTINAIVDPRKHTHTYDEITGVPTGVAPHKHVGTDVTLTGYSKAGSYSGVVASDNVNVAIGKLEKGLDTKANTSGTYVDMIVGKAKQLETARTFSLSGGVTGSGTFNGTGDCVINTTVSPSSHNHDDRYYTKSQMDSSITTNNLKINIGEGLEFLGDDNYFGTNLDARIIRLIDNNGTGGIVDGGLVVHEYTQSDKRATEILRLRGNGAEFKFMGNNVYHSGNLTAGTLNAYTKTETDNGFLKLRGQTTVDAINSVGLANGCYDVRGTISGLPGGGGHYNLINYGEYSTSNSKTQMLFPYLHSEDKSEMYFRTARGSDWRPGNWCRVWHSNNFDPDDLSRGIRNNSNAIADVDAVNREYTFEIGGDANTYYPVFIETGYRHTAILNIYRSYHEKAPDSWYNSSTHHGGLNLSLFMRIGGTTWDGDPTEVTCLRFGETYITIAAKIVLDARGLYIWLRGGGAVYHMMTSSKYTSDDLRATVYLNGLKYKDLGGSYAQYYPDLVYNPGSYSDCGSANSIKDLKVIRKYEMPSYLDTKWTISTTSVDSSSKGIINGSGGLWLGSDNELNFTSNSANYLFNYRQINGARIDNFYFGNGTGASGQRNGNIFCGTLNANNGSINGTFSASRFSATSGATIRGDMECQNITSTGSISVQGNISCNRVDFRDDVINPSDIRLKNDIKPISHALSIVEKLRGVSFTRNDLEDKTKRHVGLIAQEVQKVVPELVDYVDKEKGLLGVKYDKIVAYLIEAIKEQQKMINELKN